MRSSIFLARQTPIPCLPTQDGSRGSTNTVVQPRKLPSTTSVSSLSPTTTVLWGPGLSDSLRFAYRLLMQDSTSAPLQGFFADVCTTSKCSQTLVQLRQLMRMPFSLTEFDTTQICFPLCLRALIVRRASALTIQNRCRETRVSSLSNINILFYYAMRGSMSAISPTDLSRQWGTSRPLLAITANRILIIQIQYQKRLCWVMANQEELNEIKDKYLDYLNRVNLLLLKEHDLRRDQKLYTSELSKVDALIETIKSGRRGGINVVAEDSYLREMIRENDKELMKLERKLKGQDLLFSEVEELKKKHQKYLDMMSSQFQNNIQQRLSTIRGKVDELKKKIKEINKETLSFEQEHLEGIDQYSFCLFLVDDYSKQNAALREEIAQLKNKLKR